MRYLKFDTEQTKMFEQLGFDLNDFLEKYYLVSDEKISKIIGFKNAELPMYDDNYIPYKGDEYPLIIKAGDLDCVSLFSNGIQEFHSELYKSLDPLSYFITERLISIFEARHKRVELVKTKYHLWEVLIINEIGEREWVTYKSVEL